MISLISSLSLKLYVDLLLYHWNIFGSSSKVFSNLRTPSEIFGKCLGAFVWTRKSSESGRKSSENHQQRCHQYVYIIKRTLHVNSKIWISCSRGWRTITHLFAALSRETLSLPLKHKIHIFSPPCNILYLGGMHLICEQWKVRNQSGGWYSVPQVLKWYKTYTQYLLSGSYMM